MTSAEGSELARSAEEELELEPVRLGRKCLLMLYLRPR